MAKQESLAGDILHLGAPRPQSRKPYDSDVTFEEYHYYAQKTRAEESTLESPSLNLRQLVTGKKDKASPAESLTEKDYTAYNRSYITDEDWTNASRALRTTSWGAGFFLITTDVLGPYSTGFAMGTLGWGPGIAFYTVFGGMAAYSGYLIWRTYLGIDSYEFPAKNFGDIGFRTLGKLGRHVTNTFQALSLLLLVGQVTLQYSENISQISHYKLCYVVCPIIFTIVGFGLSQIRTLKAYGWIANLAVWLNLLAIFITIGVMANSPPNYKVSTLGSAGSAVDRKTITPVNGTYPDIIHYATTPSDGLVGAVNGMLSGVLAYSGVQLFTEFMTEMRRPRDFLKSIFCAQLFIYTVYLAYGCIVYHCQGQYAFSPSYQGLSIYAWQVAANVITLFGGLICGGLYGNIGVKVIYSNLFMGVFNAPPLTTSRGKLIYAGFVPIFWVVGFVVAAAIPDYFGFVSVIAASLLLSLTYTFPALFALAFDVQKNAMCPGDGFNATTGETKRTFTALARWRKGFCSGGAVQVGINIWHVIVILGFTAMSGLGLYAAIMGMVDAFKLPQLTSFSCTSPLNLNG